MTGNDFADLPMKRRWLYAGIAIASVLQFFFEGLWHELLFKNSYGDLQPLLRPVPQLLYNFLSESAFAGVAGFFYLHIPNERRSVKTGISIGSILGLLIALYQFLGRYGSFNMSIYVVVLELIKTTILGIICGSVIAFMELKLNAGNRAASK